MHVVESYRARKFVDTSPGCLSVHMVFSVSMSKFPLFIRTSTHNSHYLEIPHNFHFALDSTNYVLSLES